VGELLEELLVATLDRAAVDGLLATLLLAFGLVLLLRDADDLLRHGASSC
jgi:hypothetical protein